MWKYCTKRAKKETCAMVTGKGRHDGRSLFKYLFHKIPKISAYLTIILIRDRLAPRSITKT